MNPVYRNTDQIKISRVPRDLIRSRELLLELIWKDMRIRYRYAVLGFLWAIVEPLALMLVLTFVFTYAFSGKIPLAESNNSPPFAVSLLCGLIFWQFFATALSRATHSLIENQNLVKKVYFTREIIPIASLGYPAFNLLIGFVLLLAIHLLLGGSAGIAFIWVFFILAVQLIMMTGLALLLSALHVRYRDIGYIVSVAVVLGFYASPVFYPIESITESDLLPQWAQTVYLANPMALLLTAYRQIIFELRFPDLWLLIWPSIAALLSFGSGIFIFRRMAPTFSDHL